MKGLCNFLVVFGLVVGCSSLTACGVADVSASNYGYSGNAPFVYDTWEGIPRGKVRLKGYCPKPGHKNSGQWILNAVSNPQDGKPALSQSAIDYLNWINVPTGACKSDSSIGSALWDISTNTITVDDTKMNNLWQGRSAAIPEPVSYPVSERFISPASASAPPVIKATAVKKYSSLKLTLRGPADKAALVRNQFVADGWTGKIETIVAPDNNVVSVFVNGVYEKDIPTSNTVLSAGLCEDQKRRIVQVVNDHLKTAPAVATGAKCDFTHLVRTPMSKRNTYSANEMNGEYMTIGNYCGVRVVVNNRDDKRYGKNEVSAKLECHLATLTDWPYGKNWGPTMVVRNPEGVDNIFDLIDLNWHQIGPYLEQLMLEKSDAPFINNGVYGERNFRMDGSYYNS